MDLPTSLDNYWNFQAKVIVSFTPGFIPTAQRLIPIPGPSRLLNGMELEAKQWCRMECACNTATFTTIFFINSGNNPHFIKIVSEVAEQQGSLQLRTSMPYSWCYLQAIPYTWGFIKKALDKEAMLSSTPENPASDMCVPVSLVR